jgi:hypothetical protein
VLNVRQSEDIPRVRDRLIVTVALIKFSQVFDPVYFADLGSQAELRLVLHAVWYGHLTGRPMTALKLAEFIGMPRATVRRKLADLVRLGCAEQNGTRYYVSERDLTRPPLIDQAIKVILEAANALRDPRVPVDTRLGNVTRRVSGVAKMNTSGIDLKKRTP